MRGDEGPAGARRVAGPAAGGPEREAERLFPVVYEELRAVARRRLERERRVHTLQPTALVNEAWLKLAASRPQELADRAHFVALVGRAMRQVLVDHARRRAAAKRGGGGPTTTLTGKGLGLTLRLDELLALDQALERLGRVDDRLLRVVEHKFFGGLTDAETAALLGVTPRAVSREWARARAWLHAELDPIEASGGGE